MVILLVDAQLSDVVQSTADDEEEEEETMKTSNDEGDDIEPIVISIEDDDSPFCAMVAPSCCGYEWCAALGPRNCAARGMCIYYVVMGRAQR